MQALDKLRPFRLGEHQIADRKLTDLAILECTAEIFRTSLNPAFADLDVWRGELRRARRRWSSALHVWLNVNYKVIALDVIANLNALVQRSLVEQDVD